MNVESACPRQDPGEEHRRHARCEINDVVANVAVEFAARREAVLEDFDAAALMTTTTLGEGGQHVVRLEQFENPRLSGLPHREDVDAPTPERTP